MSRDITVGNGSLLVNGEPLAVNRLTWNYAALVTAIQEYMGR